MKKGFVWNFLLARGYFKAVYTELDEHIGSICYKKVIIIFENII